MLSRRSAFYLEGNNIKGNLTIIKQEALVTGHSIEFIC